MVGWMDGWTDKCIDRQIDTQIVICRNINNNGTKWDNITSYINFSLSFLSGNSTFLGPLQQALVPPISNAVCSSPQYYGNAITDRMICAGFSQGGIDTCNVSEQILVVRNWYLW